MADERQDPQRAGEKPAPRFIVRLNELIRLLLAALLLAGVGVAGVAIVAWALQPDSAPEGAGFVYTNPDSGQAGYRTLWDWLGLLIVPLAVAAGAGFISYMQKRTELDIARKAREEDREIARQARESEQQIASDRLRQATLEGYYDRMTELLLEYGLGNSKDENPKARSIARARTVAVVKGLDGERNGQLFAFLKTSQLIEKEAPIVDLRGADLSKADLRGVDLSEVNLHEADLRETDLSLADLGLADLSRAVLSEADLRETDLSLADLNGAFLNGAFLGRANLFVAKLSGALLALADLSEANLGEADLSAANLLGAILNDAILNDAILSGADLIGANLSRAKGWTIAQLEQARTVEGSIMPDGTRLGFEATEYSEATAGLTFAEWKAQYLAGPE